MEGLGIEQLAELRTLRFGYIPYQAGANSPGDRRRFPLVAKKLDLRWEIFREEGEYDVVYLSSNADLTHFHRQQGGPRLVFEMVDSYAAVPGWEPKSLVRGVGKWLFKRHRHLELSYTQTVKKMCRRADLVVCSMPEQLTQLSQWNQNTHDILDFHEELGGLPLPPVPEGKKVFELFWEGVGLSASQFSAIGEVLANVARDYPLRLHLVTDLKYKPINAPIPPWETRRMVERLLGPVPFFLSEWNPTSVRALASQCDLGLIPICLDKPLFRDKPENKLLIMWRLGLPVVVSATPAYQRSMQAYGGPVWACPDPQSWEHTLREALGNPETRRLAAAKGMSYAETTFGSEALLARWQRALSTLID